MARPRKFSLVAERARTLHRQLGAALQVLQELRGCLEKLSEISVDPVYVELVERRKSTRYGEYVYPVLMFCSPGGTPWDGGCEEVYATRFKEYARALVEADRFARLLEQLAAHARRVLGELDRLGEVLQRLQEFPSAGNGKVSQKIDGESAEEPAGEVAALG